MTKDEFIEQRDKFKEGDEVKIRYYTYNKNDYIDVFGRVFSMYGRFGKSIIGGTHYLSIEYLGTYKIHEGFVNKNLPQLNLFRGINGAQFCNIRSDQITFIKSASLRAYKIHQLRNKKG
jgi:hypothetical protein